MAEKIAYSPETLIKAYALGVFPMADSADSTDIHFYDPDMRALIPLGPGGPTPLHIPRRLQRTLRTTPLTVTMDRAFPAVISECAAPRPDRADTWINEDIKQLYIALHKLGFAHSVEIWDGDNLVGGLYGVALRAAFFGESMFSRVTDASKIALVHLIARLRAGGFQLLDAQFTTDHLQQFGIFEVTRDKFQATLADALATHTSLNLDAPSLPMVMSLLDSLTAAPAAAPHS